MRVYWSMRILLIIFPSVTPHFFANFGISFKSIIPRCLFGIKDCDKRCYDLRTTDVCSFNPLFLNESVINETRNIIEQCNRSNQTISCDAFANSKYRSIDGRCNNLDHPHWGMAGICQQRMLPYDYADGKSALKISCLGKDLPNARKISNKIHRELKKGMDDDFTLMHTEFGQFLSHDLSLNDVFKTEESGGNIVINCCLPNGTTNDKCISIDVPPDDPYFPRCINIIKTVPCPCSTGGFLHHWNQNSAFIDASQVYGNHDEIASQLRSNINGTMKVQTGTEPGVGDLPPPIDIEELCETINISEKCFWTGDTRGNQNRLVICMHTLMLRIHNLICNQLQKINPHWDDEQLYQEGRRIVGAMLQWITYYEYLPTILGYKTMEKYGLTVGKGSNCTTYDPDLNPTIIDECVVTALRYGHTELPESFTEINPKTGISKVQNMSNFYYNPFDLYHGKFDETILGMTRDCQMKHDISLANDFREFTYRRVQFNETLGVDLAALSVMRTREHGIHGYTYYVKYLLNIQVNSFCDLKKLMSLKNAKNLQNIYSSVHDINLYTGGLAEHPVDGGIVGPTFAAILVRQFYKLKYGDSKYFENCNQTGSFTEKQLKVIRNIKLSSLICYVTKITNIQRYVFLKKSLFSLYSNPILLCKTIPKLDLSAWRETKK